MFDQSNFAPVGAHSSDTPNLYSYKTSDSITVVLMDDYFIAKSQQIRAGDFIFIQAGDDSGVFEVSADRSSVHNLLIPHVEDVLTKTYNTDAWFRNKAVTDKSILHGVFTYNVPGSKWYEMIDDVEQAAFVSATSDNGKLLLASGTLNQKRGLRTFRHPRYEPNKGHLWSDSAFFPTASAAGERSMGLFTSEAGVMFRLRAGVLYGVVRTTIDSVTTDTETVIDIPTGVDLSKGNVFDIQYQWRGVGTFFFYINLLKVAAVGAFSTTTDLSIFNPALPIAFESINQGDAVTLEVGCVDVSSEGGDNGDNTFGAISTSTESASIAISGFNQPVLVVRSKKTFNSLLNTRDVVALFALAYADQRSVFRVWATRDATAITLNDQSYQDFGDGHLEFLEYDFPDVTTPMTFDTAKATVIFSSRIDQDQSGIATALFEGLTNVYQTPGDILIFTMHRETGAAVNAGVTYEFGEAI